MDLLARSISSIISRVLLLVPFHVNARVVVTPPPSLAHRCRISHCLKLKHGNALPGRRTPSTCYLPDNLLDWMESHLRAFLWEHKPGLLVRISSNSPDLCHRLGGGIKSMLEKSLSWNVRSIKKRLLAGAGMAFPRSFRVLSTVFLSGSSSAFV